MSGIDQQNEADKAHQIPLMGDVYRLSAQVLIYLAPDLFPSVTISEILAEALTDEGYRDSEEWKQSLDYMKNAAAAFCNGDQSRISYNKVGSQLKMLCEMYTLRPWVLLYLFFKHPWFCRAWTFQELAIAQKAGFMAFGLLIDTELLQNLLEEATMELERTEETCRVPIHFQSRGRERFVSTYSVRPDTPGDKQFFSIYILNNVLPYSDVGVRQDCIYAFRAFFDQGLRPPIDYSLSWTDLLIHVTTALTRQSQSLYPLYNLQRESVRQWDGWETLPSWVLNWSEGHSIMKSVNVQRLLRFGADLRRHHRYRSHDKVSGLRVVGSAIDSIDLVFAGSDYRTDDKGLARLPEFLEFLRASEQVVESHQRIKKQCESYSVEAEQRTALELRVMKILDKSKNGTTSNEPAQLIVRGLIRLEATDCFMREMVKTTENDNDIANDLAALVDRKTDDRLCDGLMVLINKWHVFTSDGWTGRSSYWRSPWDHTSSLRIALHYLMQTRFYRYSFLAMSEDFGYTYGPTQKGDLVSYCMAQEFQ
jgi:hypothetical protein